MKSITGIAASMLGLAAAVSAQSAAEKVASLRSAATQVDRIKLLGDDEFIFDFLNAGAGETTGLGGHTVAASSSNFPALIGNGIAMTVGFLGPCGLNTPHTHPRATEINFVVNGSVQSGFLAENGARFVFNEIPPGSAAIFPKGAIHFEFNNACEDALFVAAFNDEDPGVDQIAQRFFGLPPIFVAAALGGIGVEEVAGLEAKIPDNIALGTAECIKRCGLDATTQPSLQRQQRVAANALPAGFSGPAPPAGAAPTPSPPAGTSAGAAASAATSTPLAPMTVTPQKAAGNAEIAPQSGSKTFTGLTIALLVAVCVLALGYIALAAWYVLGKEKRIRTRGMTYYRTGGDLPERGPPLFDAEKKQPFETYHTSSAHDLSNPYDPPSSPNDRHSSS